MGNTLKIAYGSTFISTGSQALILAVTTTIRGWGWREASRIPAKKSCNSHLFGVVPSWYAETAFVPELSKAITFCLRSYPGEISHSNSPNRQLSNDISDVVVRRRKVALHTLCQLKCDKALIPPLRRVVEFRASYG